MEIVYEASNLIDAHLVRIELEQAGIPAFVLGEALLGGVGELPACGLLSVQVPSACGPQARALVQALPLATGDAPGRAADAQEPEAWPDGIVPA